MGQLDDAARGRIKRWMLEAGATQKDLAGAAGWLQPTVSKYLHGKMNAGLDELRGMASFLGYSLADVVDDLPVLPTDGMQFVARFNVLPESTQKALLALMATFPRQNRAMTGEGRRSYKHGEDTRSSTPRYEDGYAVEAPLSRRRPL